jgi:molybdopterin-guanine dinucleotide biosynthesis protein A
MGLAGMSSADGDRAVAFTGVVLAGGSSSRMGRDKAFIEVDGRPLVTIAVGALRAGGASRVVVVGGDAARIGALDPGLHPGLDLIVDEHPGDGPLGGLVSGLRAADDPIAMVLACDMPAIDGDTVAFIVGALASHATALVAAPRVGDRLQILTAAYRLTVLPVLDAAFVAGERAPRRALGPVEVTEVVGVDPNRLDDVDRPQDLSRYAQPGHTPGAPRKAMP